MEQPERQKLVNMFKSAISYEELNLVMIQNDCLSDLQELFPEEGPQKQRCEEILTKLILDSLSHALIFANLVMKIYGKDLQKFPKTVKD